MSEATGLFDLGWQNFSADMIARGYAVSYEIRLARSKRLAYWTQRKPDSRQRPPKAHVGASIMGGQGVHPDGNGRTVLVAWVQSIPKKTGV
jgi:hypothetical protein